MKLVTKSALAAIALSLTGTVHAATTLIEWGTLATISTYTCTTDFCGDDVADLLTLAVDPAEVSGGNNQTSASVARGTWPAAGTASANVTVASGLGIPVVTASAASEPGKWIAGQALAIQAYEYTGTGESISLTWGLTGNVANPDSDPNTGLVVFAGFFTSDQLPSFPTIDESDPFSTAFLLGILAMSSPADNFVEFTATGAQNETGTIQIDNVANGDEFYLAMGLMAGAGGVGASAESLSTLVASFDEPYALAPAFVPLPGAVWMLGGALIGLAGLRRRG